MTTSRRDFLKTSAATTAAATAGFTFAAPAIAQSGSANEDLRVAVIGTGGRGGSHINGFAGAKGSRLVALCDADEKHVKGSASTVKKKFGYDVDTVVDYKELLDRDDIDAITIAAPNHWHSLMAIHGAEAGKHVYSEKPVCHNIWEGRQMVNAMKKNNVVVAGGFQNRSDKGLMEAIPQINDGKYGAITMARGLCYRNRNSIGKQDTPLSPPDSVNYDLWLGPAADIPMYRPRFHYDWHWVFNTGNGDMGNQGPHEMDLLRWALGDPTHPNKVISVGNRFAWDDAGDTPNLQIAHFDFGNDVPVLFEVRNLYQKGDKSQVGQYKNGPGVGIIITCEKGEFRGGRGGGSFYSLDGEKLESFKGDAGSTHMQNFVDCVRNNTPDKLRSPIESAFYSSCMSHLANISVLTGRPAERSEVASTISSYEPMGEVFDRFNAQLDVWEVDPANEKWHLGPELTFDGKAEKFTDGENMAKANDLVRREDRKGYEVPEIA